MANKTINNHAIPNDWKISNVGKAYEICNNLRLPISEEERKKIQGLYPYYGPTKVQDFINEYRVDGKYALIGEDGDHFLKWKELPMTLLVEGKFNVNNHAHIIKGEENLTEWFFYYFNHRELTPHLTRQGAGRYKLSKKSLEKIPIPLPSLPEQKAIAQVLSLADAAIHTTEKLIAQKELRKKWLMQNLLTGKMRIRNDELGMMDDELGKVKFGSFAKIKKGKALTSSELVDGEIPVIAGGQTSPYKHNAFTHENVITISASGAYAGFVAFHNGKIWASDCSVVEEIKGKSSTLYLFYVLQFNQGKIYKLQSGGAQPHVYPNDIHNLSLIIHNSLEEQIAIAQVLQAADKEISLLKAKAEKLREQKKGLMQLLLTGKKRLL
ncbi:MAG: restriction endonuclease subunit S [Saprospiraceae bacterium]|nr:restriction endonuclease subunit S [Saprospiraceae bacterium]